MDRSHDIPHLDAVTHRWVQAGEIEMHVAEAGSGPPLMLVHGWPQHWYAWRELIPELAREYRVICPDLRGLGWSEAPPGGYDKQTLAGDLLALMDALELDRVQYAGHDWGAYCGYLAALRAPERFERLALLGMIKPGVTPPRLTGLPLAPAYMSYQFVLATPLLGPLALRSVLKAIFKVWPRREIDGAVYVERLCEAERARATSLYYRTFLTRELMRGPGEVPDVPILRLIGDGDWIHKVTRPEPGTVVIPEAGHFLMEEAPDAVLSELKGFLTTKSRPRAALRNT